MTQAKAKKLQDLLLRLDKMQTREKETTWVEGADGVKVRLSASNAREVIEGRIEKELES